MTKIKEIKAKDWLYLINLDAKENKRLIGQELEKESNGNAGKYMFFSDDKQALILLAKEILTKYSLFNAKVPFSDEPSENEGYGFVLCVYDSEPKLKYELKNYADEKHIRYCYWKYDRDTLDGKYSAEYMARNKS